METIARHPLVEMVAVVVNIYLQADEKLHPMIYQNDPTTEKVIGDVAMVTFLHLYLPFRFSSMGLVTGGIGV